jgi:anti-sigma factor RsiW
MTGRWRTFWRRRATATPSGLTCREVVELITDYLEGALDEGDRTRFEAHLSACDGCAAYLDQMRVTVAVVGRLEPAELSEGMERELLAAFRDWRDGDGGPSA